MRFMHERQFCIVLFAVVLYERAGTAAIGEGCGKTSDQRRGGARVTALKPEKETPKKAKPVRHHDLTRMLRRSCRNAGNNESENSPFAKLFEQKIDVFHLALHL